MLSFLSILPLYIPFTSDCYVFYRLWGYTLNYRYNPKYRILSVLPIFIVSLINFHIGRTAFIENSIVYFFTFLFGYITYFFCGIFFHQNNILSKILWTVIALLCIASSEIVVIIVFKMLNIPYSLIQKNDALFIFAALLSKALVLFIIELIARLKSKTLAFPRYVTLESFAIIGINLLLLVFSVHVFETSEDTLSKNVVMTVLFAFCFSISVLTFVIIFKLSRKAQEELEEKLLIQQLEMENQMNQDMTNVMGNLRALRHDMNNHIGVLQGLAHTKQYDALETYLDELSQDISPANEFVLVESKAVSALLYHKSLKAKLKGIELDATISNSACPIPDKDMCSLLGNILDNAIEATEKTEHKYIELILSQQQGIYCIKCSNTFREMPVQIHNRFVSSKKDPTMHGIGTKNIRAIAEKYGGSCIFSFDKLFCVEVTLPFLFLS